MEGEAAGELQDWELLHNSEAYLVNLSSDSAAAREWHGIEEDSGGMIRSDYFSLESHIKYRKSPVSLSEEGSVESDNPSWIDPVISSENRFKRKNSGEFWSDSGSDRSKLSEDFVESDKTVVGVEGIGEIQAQGEYSTKYWSDSGSDRSRFSDSNLRNELGFPENEKIPRGFQGRGEIPPHDEDFAKFWSNSTGDMVPERKFEGVENTSELGVDSSLGARDGSEVSGIENEMMEDVNEGERNEEMEENENDQVVRLTSEDEEKRRVVWWKLPVELLKFCVFRVSPVWSISIAAAIVGLVILRRRLYKMKQRNRSLQIKVTMDDKKVSQFMSRAARLNEAFSVVRRVPVMRPSLPVPGVTPWPVISLR